MNTKIRRVGLEFDVYGTIDGREEYVGTRRSEWEAEQLAASWRLEQAELAAVVFARPAEPVAEPVFVQAEAQAEEVFCWCGYYATSTNEQDEPVCDFHYPKTGIGHLLPHSAVDVKAWEIRREHHLVQHDRSGDNVVEMYVSMHGRNPVLAQRTHYILVNGAYRGRHSSRRWAEESYKLIVESWLPIEAQLAERELERGVATVYARPAEPQPQPMFVPAPEAQNDVLDELLLEHVAAWWRDLDEPDFAEVSIETYNRYFAGGGGGEHFKLRWPALNAAFYRVAAEHSTGETSYYTLIDSCLAEAPGDHIAVAHLTPLRSELEHIDLQLAGAELGTERRAVLQSYRLRCTYAINAVVSLIRAYRRAAR